MGASGVSPNPAPADPPLPPDALASDELPAKLVAFEVEPADPPVAPLGGLGDSVLLHEQIAASTNIAAPTVRRWADRKKRRGCMTASAAFVAIADPWTHPKSQGRADA
jgi:hypothetical protein